MIELDDGRIMIESNAILYWLAEGTKYFQGDGWQRAQTMAWMFFEQYSHEPYIAVARFICGWTPLDSARRADLPKLRERGYQALDVMEKHLSAERVVQRQGLRHRRYRAVRVHAFCAGDGGFELARYPAIMAWLERVRGTPKFLPMPPYAMENIALIAQSA